MNPNKVEKLKALKESSSHEPVWLTIANVQKTFGIGRTKINELMQARLVKFTQVKDKHQVRGRVLINYKSLVELFESWATPQDSKS